MIHLDTSFLIHGLATANGADFRRFAAFGLAILEA